MTQNVKKRTEMFNLGIHILFSIQQIQYGMSGICLVRAHL